MTTEPYTQRLTKLPTTHYLDNRIYLDPDIFAEERRRIFEQAWNFVCLASEAPNPGDFRVVTVAGHSLLIVRGEDGRLHLVSPVTINIQDKEANSVSSFAIFRTTQDGVTQCYAVGQYEDTLVKGEGAWRFLQRTVRLHTQVLETATHVPF